VGAEASLVAVQMKERREAVDDKLFKSTRKEGCDLNESIGFA
jgi:hypothetical protein